MAHMSSPVPRFASVGKEIEVQAGAENLAKKDARPLEWPPSSRPRLPVLEPEHLES
jgi:hypothetical protein